VTETPAQAAARTELERRVEATTRITLRPIASPAALGFIGLAGATLTLAGLQLGWVDAAEGSNVGLIALAFTVPLQLLASIFGFLARDGVIATGMGMLSGIWFAIALTLLTSDPGSTSDALGLFLLGTGAAMWIPATTAATSKLVPALVLGTAGLRFVLGGLHQLTSSEGWEDMAGIVGLFLFAFAMYAALAAELEDAQKRTILPLGRRGKGKVAVEGSLVDQVLHVDSEPGVKQQL
jgi:succinate-acetate transporter protein